MIRPEVEVILKFTPSQFVERKPVRAQVGFVLPCDNDATLREKIEEMETFQHLADLVKPLTIEFPL